MMVLAIIAGALIGAAMQPLGFVTARFLLKSRGKTLEPSRRETVLLCIVLACFGACIGFCAQTIPTACFLFVMLYAADIAATTDYHHRIIPNELVAGLFIVRIAFGIPDLAGVAGFPAFDLVSSALGCIVCLLIFIAPSIMGKQVGAGDVKFVAAMGFCLGLIMSLGAVVLMGILVLAYSLYARQLAFAERLKQLVPMAPFLCVAMMVALLVQMSPAALT